VRDATGRRSPFAVLMLQASAISKVPPGKVVSNDRQPLPRARTLLLGMIAKSAPGRARQPGMPCPPGARAKSPKPDRPAL